MSFLGAVKKGAGVAKAFLHNHKKIRNGLAVMGTLGAADVVGHTLNRTDRGENPVTAVLCGVGDTAADVGNVAKGAGGAARCFSNFVSGMGNVAASAGDMAADISENGGNLLSGVVGNPLFLGACALGAVSLLTGGRAGSFLVPLLAVGAVALAVGPEKLMNGIKGIADAIGGGAKTAAIESASTGSLPASTESPGDGRHVGKQKSDEGLSM
jgi:hypothetical protein